MRRKRYDAKSCLLDAHVCTKKVLGLTCEGAHGCYWIQWLFCKVGVCVWLWDVVPGPSRPVCIEPSRTGSSESVPCKRDRKRWRWVFEHLCFTQWDGLCHLASSGCLFSTVELVSEERPINTSSFSISCFHWTSESTSESCSLRKQRPDLCYVSVNTSVL